MLNNKGVANWRKILFWILIIILIPIIYFFLLVPVLKQSGYNPFFSNYSNYPEFFSFAKVFTPVVLKGLIVDSFKQRDFSLFTDGVTLFLGLNRTFGDFVYSFFVGLLSGIWLFLLYKIFTSLEGIFSQPGNPSNTSFLQLFFSSGFKGSWVEKISDRIWKPFLIGALYGILMQVPFLNLFLEIISFRYFGINFILQSILIAFYIGIFPTAYWGYRRFKLIKYYQSKLLQKRYEAQAMQALTR